MNLYLNTPKTRPMFVQACWRDTP